MFALEVEFLTGRYAACDRTDRQRPEWPPHPGRLFHALVWTLYTAFGADDGNKSNEERRNDPERKPLRAALRWLEEQKPPVVAAPEPVSAPESLTVFVPRNDLETPRGKTPKQFATEPREIASGLWRGTVKTKKGEAPRYSVNRTEWYSAAQVEEGIEVIPDQRGGRQPRHFPYVRLADDRQTVVFLWEKAEPSPGHREALARLVTRLAYVGHSSSLVRVAVCDERPLVERAADATAPASTPQWFAPDRDGELVLRVPTEGRLEELEDEHQRNVDRGKDDVCSAGPWASYRLGAAPGDPDAVPSAFERVIVFRRVEGPPHPLAGALVLTQAVRGALLKHCPEPLPETLSGHGGNGSKSERTHLAIVPLAFVGSEYADGDVKGFALVLPRAGEHCPKDELEALFVTLADDLGAWDTHSREIAKRDGQEHKGLRVCMGRAGVWQVERVPPAELHLHGSRRSLDPNRYRGLGRYGERGARTWTTVTPMLFDRFPKKPPKLGECQDRASGQMRRGRRGHFDWMHAEDAPAIVAQACVNIGLPEPARVTVVEAGTGEERERLAVEIGHVARLRGVPPSHAFDLARLHRTRAKNHANGADTGANGKPRRLYAHVTVTFDKPVRGPVLLGAGRYLGLGLCLPLDHGGR